MKVQLFEGIQEIDKETLAKLISSDFSQAYNRYIAGFGIFKGLHLPSLSPFSYLTPVENRESKNTKNYYTLWMNNNSEWKNYPKRNVICSSNPITASHYDRANRQYNLILPKNDSKIGIVMDEDIWDVSLNTLKTSLNTVVEFIDKIFHAMRINVTTYNEMINAFSTFEKLDQEERLNILNDAEIFSSYLKRFVLHYGLFETMKEAVPQSRFKLTTIEQYSVKTHAGKEVWFNNDALVINRAYIDELDDLNL